MKKANLLVIESKKARKVRDECPVILVGDAKRINHAIAIHRLSSVELGLQ
ncbi:hypothetical protein HG532_07260 [Moraxella osloensis]|nr:hypothetical protein [Moraxella osloensis]MBW4009819.1 hypothetical protein [Moraxella osloensis]